MPKKKDLAPKVPKVAEGSDVASSASTRRPYDGLAALQCMRSAGWQYIEQPRVNEIVSEASIDLYHGMEPRNAQEASLCMMAVALTNASLDCLTVAARVSPVETELRDLNLRLGMKLADSTARLFETLEKLRGRNPNNVHVGSVNVEPGAQAIVGTVDASRNDKGPSSSPQRKKSA